MLEGILIYVCLLPNSNACRSTSQAYVIENKQMITHLETRVKNMAGPTLVAATPYVAFAVKQEATVVLTKNVSIKMKREETALGFTYSF